MKLENGESAILDGKSYTIDGKKGYYHSDSTSGVTDINSARGLMVSGSGTLTIKNATLNGGEFYSGKCFL